MAAIGVFRRNLSRAALAPAPEIERITPSLKSNLMTDSDGASGLYW